MIGIAASVGYQGFNSAVDVMTVETMLYNHRRWLDPLPHLVPDGNCAPETIVAIRRFQETACALPKDSVTGVVNPGSFTFKRLQLGYIPRPKNAVFDQMCWYRDENELEPADYEAAALAIGCEVEVIQAVAEQEAGIRGPWDENGRPTILFERHKFSKHTANAWDKLHSDISNPTWGGYGKFSAQYPKLFRAATLDEAAALKSASWGAFQILGENHEAAGYASVDEFVAAMMSGHRAQLGAFVNFINYDRRLKKALIDKEWATFARLYNGPAYKANQYDVKMAELYKRLVDRKYPLGRPAATTGGKPK